MIAVIRGKVILSDATSIVVECGGLGYQVFVTSELLEKTMTGTEVFLYTYLQVREDGIALYGFQRQDEKRLFEQLLSVSGIGPKGAMAILSFLGADGLRYAVVSSDARKISKAPGIGAKTAQKIILELKDKVDLEASLAESTDSSYSKAQPVNQAMKDACLALVELGYSEADAIKAVNQVDVSDNLEADGDYYLKMALKKLL